MFPWPMSKQEKPYNCGKSNRKVTSTEFFYLSLSISLYFIQFLWLGWNKQVIKLRKNLRKIPR